MNSKQMATAMRLIAHIDVFDDSNELVKVLRNCGGIPGEYYAKEAAESIAGMYFDLREATALLSKLAEGSE